VVRLGILGFHVRQRERLGGGGKSIETKTGGKKSRAIGKISQAKSIRNLLAKSHASEIPRLKAA